MVKKANARSGAVRSASTSRGYRAIRHPSARHSAMREPMATTRSATDALVCPTSLSAIEQMPVAMTSAK
jgi:hypothetical protein